MYKRYDWRIELVSIALLLFQLYFSINSTMALQFVPFIISCLIFFILSIVMYFSLSPKVVFKNKTNMEYYGSKNLLSESEKLFYIRKAVLYSSIFKLCIMIIPGQIIFMEIFFLKSSLLNILFTFSFLILAFYMIILYINNLIKANGYIKASLMDTLNYGVLYNNPNDKRSVVDKSFGIGSTVNLATKEGRMILWTILAIPATIIILLLVVFLLSGKI